MAFSDCRPRAEHIVAIEKLVLRGFQRHGPRCGGNVGGFGDTITAAAAASERRQCQINRTFPRTIHQEKLCPDPKGASELPHGKRRLAKVRVFAVAISAEEARKFGAPMPRSQE